MSCRYSQCTGETLRRWASERSSGRPAASSPGTIGTGAPRASAMRRRVLREAERPGLRRDVARREVLPEEALEVGPLDLAHHLAGAVGLEAVDHHPVVAEDARGRGGSRARSSLSTSSIALIRPISARARCSGSGPAGGGSNSRMARPSAPMHRDVEAPPVGEREAEEPAGWPPSGAVAIALRRSWSAALPEHVDERGPEELPAVAEHVRGVGRMVQHPRRRAVAGEQAAVRLDAAGNVDRLPVAGGRSGVWRGASSGGGSEVAAGSRKDRLEHRDGQPPRVHVVARAVIAVEGHRPHPIRRPRPGRAARRARRHGPRRGGRAPAAAPRERSARGRPPPGAAAAPRAAPRGTAGRRRPRPRSDGSPAERSAPRW